MALLTFRTNPPDVAGGYYATFKNKNGQMWNPNTDSLVANSKNRDDFDVQAIQQGSNPDETGEYLITIPALLPVDQYEIGIYKEDSISARSWADDTLHSEFSKYWNGIDLTTEQPEFWTLLSAIGSQTIIEISGIGPQENNALVGYKVRLSHPSQGEDGGFVSSVRTVISDVYSDPVHTLTLNAAPDFTLTEEETVEFFRPSGGDVVFISGSSTAADNASAFFTTGYGPLIARTTVNSVPSQTRIVLNNLSQAGEPSYNGCTVIIRDSDNPHDVLVGVITSHAIDPEEIFIEPQGTVPFTIAVGDIVEILPPGFQIEDRALLTTVETEVTGTAGSGGGTLSARVGYSSLAPDSFLQIIQGEEKTITLVVEADGRFDQVIAEEIRVGFRDPEGNTIIKEDEDVERICQEQDIQVIRTTLTPDETYELIEGLLIIEIAFDQQKARLIRAMKVIEGVIGT